jgi:hypothetical protein
LSGGDRIFAVLEGRLRAIPIERVGELSDMGVSSVLVRAPGLGPGSRVMITHLPNAVEGLKVQEVKTVNPAVAQGAAVRETP